MSPFRSSAGPATQRMPTPSLGTMYARLVFRAREARRAARGRGPCARARRLERDVELLLEALLSYEVVQSARPERAVELVSLGTDGRCEELLAHAALRACRTRSSGGASGSVVASARSASTSE